MRRVFPALGNPSRSGPGAHWDVFQVAHCRTHVQEHSMHVQSARTLLLAGSIFVEIQIYIFSHFFLIYVYIVNLHTYVYIHICMSLQ